MNDIVRSDGGQIAIRGFHAQTLTCLLEMFRNDSWVQVTLEPNVDSEKVDILWEFRDGQRRAVQVKSSINQIGLNDVKRWESELISWRDAEQYELSLIGPVAESVTKGWDGQRVVIPTPKPLELDILLDAAAQRLGEYLEGRNRSVGQRFAKMLVSAMIENLLRRATTGMPMARVQFEAEFETWTRIAIAERTEAFSVELIDELKNLLQAQFELVLAYAEADESALPSKYAPQAERAKELVKWANDENKLKKLTAAIEKVKNPR